MPRPPEYENRIKTKAFEPVARTKGAVEGFLNDAAYGLEVASSIDVKRPKQRFILAYEGFYALVQAVLELHEVRTKEAGRNLARLALRFLSAAALGVGLLGLASAAQARSDVYFSVGVGGAPEYAQPSPRPRPCTCSRSLCTSSRRRLTPTRLRSTSNRRLPTPSRLESTSSPATPTRRSASGAAGNGDAITGGTITRTGTTELG
jgi:hypothetical protein